MAGYEWGERWDMAVAMPPNPHKILDVGCGSGMGFIDWMRRGVPVIGVDLDPNGIDKARRRLSEAHVMDIERDPLPAEWHCQFDVVAFCDCLEHLVNPWSVLRTVRSVLRPGGRVIASLPNVRQWRVIAKLMAGRWHYHDDAGIMNRGHLHFFTRNTIRDLFTTTGYGEPAFYFPRRTFHLRRPERIVNRLSLGIATDVLYDSYTVSAEYTGGAPIEDSVALGSVGSTVALQRESIRPASGVGR